MLLNNNTDSDADKYNVNATKDICDFCESLIDSKSIIDNGTDIN